MVAQPCGSTRGSHALSRIPPDVLGVLCSWATCGDRGQSGGTVAFGMLLREFGGSVTCKPLPSDILLCKVCQQPYARRDLGICFGLLRCQSCWPGWLDERVSSMDDAGDASYSKAGYAVLVHRETLK